MKILFISAEVAPFAKVGGLADVAGSLPKALRDLGHDVKVFMPGYGMVTEGHTPFRKGLSVPVNPNWTAKADCYELDMDGVPVWLVGNDEVFTPTQTSEQVYAYGRDAYLFFAQAALALCEAEGWIPDVLHANDWHTGFVPVFLREKGGPRWKRTASVFTIHNLLYQGTFGKDTLDVAGLPESLFTMDKLETWGGINFIKSACVYAERVNTVSPTYAKEITTAEYGAGQWGLMSDLKQLGKLRGILNGIDYDFFNPEADPHIASKFSPEDLTGKAACKAALQAECGFEVNPSIPLVGIVSRLSDQKGFDLILKQAYAMLDQPVQFVALGTGDPWAAEQLRQLQAEWPDRVHFAQRYDAPFAQRIYAGSDLFLMPSAFEPCGLGQMIACRYGTLPIVRRTGGLADSIVEGQNGFVFEHKTARELLTTLKRALSAYHSSEEWAKLVRQAMTTDFGWTVSAKQYEEMYRDAVQARSATELLEV